MSGSSDSREEKTLFEKALAALRLGDLREAQKLFQQVVALGGRRRDEAERFLAEIETRLLESEVKGVFRAIPEDLGLPDEPSSVSSWAYPGSTQKPVTPSPAKSPTDLGNSDDVAEGSPSPQSSRSPRPPTSPSPFEMSPPPFEAAEKGTPEPSAGPTAAPAPLRRSPHLDVDPPAPTGPGATLTVSVYADTRGFAKGESGDEIQLQGGKDRYDLRVWLVTSSHFERIGPTDQPLTIRRDQDRSNTATFSLRVRTDIKSGEGAAISAYFTYDSRACGRVSRKVAIDLPSPQEAAEKPLLKETEETSPPASIQIEPGAKPADLSVRIIAIPASDGRTFESTVTTSRLCGFENGQSEIWQLPSLAHTVVDGFMSDFTAKDATDEDRGFALRGAGISLFEVAPKFFRDAYWALLDAGTPPDTISIVSEEPYIPWELMVPTRTLADGSLDDREPLGATCRVGRWTTREHIHPPQRLSLKDGYVVAPTDSKLATAEDEAAMVLREFPGDRIEPAAQSRLNAMLGRQARTLLHFICHGESTDSQILLLQGKQRFKPSALRAMPGAKKAFHEGRPFVFLNACEVGRTVPALVGVGGFADTFMTLGASAVVAPLWSVKDSIAHEVAVKFYERMKAEPKTPLAEILRDLRRLSYAAGGGEDTWAAYCFYGDPLATCAPAGS